MTGTRNLESYIDQKINFWKSYQGEDPMRLPLTDAEADSIVEHLECELSPENLHCDGEISRTEAQRKYNFFMRVHAELEAHMGRTFELYI